MYNHVVVCALLTTHNHTNNCCNYTLVRAAYFDNFTNSTEVTLNVTYEHDWILDGPEQVCL